MISPSYNIGIFIAELRSYLCMCNMCVINNTIKSDFDFFEKKIQLQKFFLINREVIARTSVYQPINIYQTWFANQSINYLLRSKMTRK